MKKLSFEYLKEVILKFDVKPIYQQAFLIILQDIFKNAEEEKSHSICECGDHIDLHGKRDYQYKNGKYYCTDCMDVSN